jgi:smad nuclear-interacting protein 1
VKAEKAEPSGAGSEKPLSMAENIARISKPLEEWQKKLPHNEKVLKEEKEEQNSKLKMEYRTSSREVWGKPDEEEKKEEEEVKKEEVNFEASGLLAKEDNQKNGVDLKFTLPPEARKPNKKWRLYVFKGGEQLKLFHMHRNEAYLFGKDRKVADVPTDHETCSKQHAVLIYRHIKGKVTPYVMDLESTNGTFLNGERIEKARYYELREKDVLTFGRSQKEFVLLHAGSANDIELDEEEVMKGLLTP